MKTKEKSLYFKKWSKRNFLKRREYYKLYRQKNYQKIKERLRIFYANNRLSILAKMRQKRIDNGWKPKAFLYTRKICYLCKRSSSELMVHSRRKSGAYFICRKCNTNTVKKYRETEKGRLAINKAVYRSIEKYRYKQNARMLLNYHVLHGNIQKPDKCSKCNKKTKVEGHHSDYTQPLLVDWLCRGCHTLV